jgi:CRISPR system Cascade subunit CasA
VGLAYEDELEPGKTLRAEVIRVCTQQDRLTSGEQRRIRAFGYDMDNMKARCWYEAEMPLYLVSRENIDAFAGVVETLVTAAVNVAGRLRSAVRDAWLPSSSEARGDLSVVTDAFYESTETEFYRIAQAMADGSSSASTAAGEWRTVLQKDAMKIFIHYAASGELVFANPARVAKARDKLGKYVYGQKLATELGIARQGENTA